MATRIGINGFGRMGRLALRAGWGRPDLEFVHINEIAGGPATAAHLLTFDSVHGRWDRTVDAGESSLRSTDVREFSAATTPGEVPGRRPASTSCSSAPGSSERPRRSTRTSTPA